MWWAADTAAATSDPRLALIAAIGSVLTASLPVLISKMRDRSAPKPPPAAPTPPAGQPGGKHHREPDAATLIARIDDGQSLLNRLIADLQRRAEAAESEVRLLRGQMDSLESVIYQQRWEIERLRAALQDRPVQGGS